LSLNYIFFSIKIVSNEWHAPSDKGKCCFFFSRKSIEFFYSADAVETSSQSLKWKWNYIYIHFLRAIPTLNQKHLDQYFKRPFKGVRHFLTFPIGPARSSRLCYFPWVSLTLFSAAPLYPNKFLNVHTETSVYAKMKQSQKPEGHNLCFKWCLQVNNYKRRDSSAIFLPKYVMIILVTVVTMTIIIKNIRRNTFLRNVGDHLQIAWRHISEDVNFQSVPRKPRIPQELSTLSKIFHIEELTEIRRWLRIVSDIVSC
jgi:hypothetical protein